MQAMSSILMQILLESEKIICNFHYVLFVLALIELLKCDITVKGTGEERPVLVTKLLH